jgi:hypothetical protein
MKKALWILALLIIIGFGAYVVLMPSGAVAPAPAASQTAAQNAPAQVPADTVQKPPADTGAGGVYDPNAPRGSAAECAACGQYTGSQKAQCLAALNCQ